MFFFWPLTVNQWHTLHDVGYIVFQIVPNLAGMKWHSIFKFNFTIECIGTLLICKLCVFFLKKRRNFTKKNATFQSSFYERKLHEKRGTIRSNIIVWKHWQHGCCTATHLSEPTQMKQWNFTFSLLCFDPKKMPRKNNNLKWEQVNFENDTIKKRFNFRS